jgi:hypothetical protein
MPYLTVEFTGGEKPKVFEVDTAEVANSHPMVPAEPGQLVATKAGKEVARYNICQIVGYNLGEKKEDE